MYSRIPTLVDPLPMNQLSHASLLIFLLSGLFTFTASAQENYARMREESFIHIRGSEIEYMPSGDTMVRFDQARRAYVSGKFISNQKPDLNLGIARDNYWVRFAIQNETDAKKLYVVLENPRLNDVEIFVLQDDSLTLHTMLGDNYAFDQRPINFNQFAFPLLFEKNKARAEVFLYIRHKGNTLQMPIQVMDDNHFITWVENGYLIAGLTTGVFGITFFFGVFFLFNTRDRLFIYYSCYILSAGVWLWATEGFGFQYIWPGHPELATRLGPGISGVSAVFFMACCLQFCKPYDSQSLYRKALLILLTLLTLWSVQPFNPWMPITEGTMSAFLTVYFSMNIVIALSMATYLILLSRKGYRIVLYYFTAVAVTMICSMIIVLRGVGIISLPVSSGIIMSGGYIVEIILMTAGITQQFYRYKKEREDTLIAYLDQQKSITQQIISTIESERKRIGRELHDDIGSGLTQIALMTESAKHLAPEKKGEELNDIATTTRRLVTSIGEIIWALHPENKTLGQLLIYIREQLHKLLEYSGIHYTIQFPDNVGHVELNNTQLRNILLITKEVVNNAVKYSQAKNIIIRCSCENKLISMEITDDGIGMDLTQVKIKNGLKNIRLRAEEMGGSLELLSQPGQGTICRYQVPG